MKVYHVKDIFGPTIQGEGKGTGEVVMFLRFAGCNKWSGREEDKASSACPFCDTDFTGGQKMTKEQIVARLQQLQGFGANYVKTLVISGGEPTLQLDVDLARDLNKYWTLYIETNGSRAIKEEIFPFIAHISCSPKQSPAETKLQRIDSLKILHPPESMERSVDAFLQDQEFMDEHRPEVFIQPVMSENYTQNLASTLEVCFKNPKVRLSLQIHKILEVK